jgi:hypothetical protein
MEKLLGRDVIRPTLRASWARTARPSSRSRAGREVLSCSRRRNSGFLSVKTSSYRCHGCGNQCLITMQKFPDGGKLLHGQPLRARRRRRKEAERRKRRTSTATSTSVCFRLLSARSRRSMRRAARSAFPRVLNMYEDYPFWFTFFTNLGYASCFPANPRARRCTTRAWRRCPQTRSAIRPSWSHGHIMDLIEKGVKKIFYPCEPYNMTR